MMSTSTTSTKYIYASGRRKSSIATIRLFSGEGENLINTKKVAQIYTLPYEQKNLMAPFSVTQTEGKYHFSAKVKGGGKAGQLDSIRLALSRALLNLDSSHRSALKKAKLLTVDSRIKEREKPGFKKARKKEQYSKR